MHDVLKQLLNGGTLAQDQTQSVFERILAGDVDPVQIACLLTLLETREIRGVRGAAVNELVGGARALRRFVEPVATWPGSPPLIDTCGTGGAPKTFNVSTIAAIVVAAASKGRLLVAKHGGLSRTGRGSAELLRELGVNILATHEIQTQCLREAGMCFSFALQHHPAMRNASGVRKSLGFPTIFNLVGPLSNPAGARRQLIGTYRSDLASRLAEALCLLGVDKAMVVHSADGLDELTTTSSTTVHTIEQGRISSSEVSPEAFGMDRVDLRELSVDSLKEAAGVAREVLSGKQGPRLDIVVLNAGAALCVGGVCQTIAEGVLLAQEATQKGEALQTLERLIKVSNTGSAHLPLA